MGREVRTVPPNWNHPESTDTYGRKGPQPMYDDHFGDVFAKWLGDFDRVRRGDLEGYERECYTSANPLAEWLNEDGRPPDPAYYRPWRDEDATWFQLWETVSEGTPVSPPFATKADLVDYLATHGDFWDQRRGDGPWQRDRAERFVDAGWAPSLIVQTGPGGGIFAPRDGAPS